MGKRCEQCPRLGHRPHDSNAVIPTEELGGFPALDVRNDVNHSRPGMISHYSALLTAIHI